MRFAGHCLFPRMESDLLPTGNYKNVNTGLTGSTGLHPYSINSNFNFDYIICKGHNPSQQMCKCPGASV